MDVTFKAPSLSDVPGIFELVKNSGALEVNTEYSYLLIAKQFSLTSAVCLSKGNVVGYLSGYRLPENPTALFVWQIAVDADFRGRGIAKGLILDVLSRPQNQEVSYVQATVAASNLASTALFKSLSNDLGCGFSSTEYFQDYHFSECHEAEPLLSVGPFQQ